MQEDKANVVENERPDVFLCHNRADKEWTRELGARLEGESIDGTPAGRPIRVFFDEVHTLKQVDAKPTDEGAQVKVVVRWEASVWNPPAAKSQRIKLDAYQTWLVRRSPATDKPVIARYVVDKLVYDKDSAKL